MKTKLIVNTASEFILPLDEKTRRDKSIDFEGKILKMLSPLYEWLLHVMTEGVTNDAAMSQIKNALNHLTMRHFANSPYTSCEPGCFDYIKGIGGINVVFADNRTKDALRVRFLDEKKNIHQKNTKAFDEFTEGRYRPLQEILIECQLDGNLDFDPALGTNHSTVTEDLGPIYETIAWIRGCSQMIVTVWIGESLEKLFQDKIALELSFKNLGVAVSIGMSPIHLPDGIWDEKRLKKSLVRRENTTCTINLSENKHFKHSPALQIHVTPDASGNHQVASSNENLLRIGNLIKNMIDHRLNNPEFIFEAR